MIQLKSLNTYFERSLHFARVRVLVPEPLLHLHVETCHGPRDHCIRSQCDGMHRLECLSRCSHWLPFVSQVAGLLEENRHIRLEVSHPERSALYESAVQLPLSQAVVVEETLAVEEIVDHGVEGVVLVQLGGEHLADDLWVNENDEEFGEEPELVQTGVE